MMVTPAVRRKAFRAALCVNNSSVEEWAVDLGVTGIHVRAVVNGRRRSAKLEHEMDAYTVRALLPFVEEYKERLAEEPEKTRRAS